jgi:hypothetical protein
MKQVRQVLQVHLTPQGYHGRADASQEAPVLGTEARREGGAPHDTRNVTIDRDKDAGRVCFLVQKRMLQVEEPARRTLPH